MTKWVRYPGPGEFRGEGKWERIEDVGADEGLWKVWQETGFLPTHEGDKPPPK